MPKPSTLQVVPVREASNASLLREGWNDSTLHVPSSSPRNRSTAYSSKSARETSPVGGLLYMLSWCREAGLCCAEVGGSGVLAPCFWADSQLEAMQISPRRRTCLAAAQVQPLLCAAAVQVNLLSRPTSTREEKPSPRAVSPVLRALRSSTLEPVCLKVPMAS